MMIYGITPKPGKKKVQTFIWSKHQNKWIAASLQDQRRWYLDGAVLITTAAGTFTDSTARRAVMRTRPTNSGVWY